MERCFDFKFMHWGDRPDYELKIRKIFDYYVIDYAETGELILERGGETELLTGPVAYLAYPGPQFRFRKQPESRIPWHHRFVGFVGPFAEELRRNGLLDLARPVIPILDPDRFSAAFDRLLHYLERNDHHPDRAVHHLLDLLLQLREQEVRRRFDQLDEHIRQLAERLRHDPLQTVDFEREAAAMKISYSHFRRVFTNGLGAPPVTFLLHLRLNRAAWLLRHRTEFSIAEIARQCGYRDTCYFNRAFRQHHGISPGRYRQAVS